MRIDKYIKTIRDLSRTDTKKLIKENIVTVNGKRIIKSDIVINEEKDIVCINGEQLKYYSNIYIMLNKASGYVCARNEENSVFDLIKDYKGYDLAIVGRLDIDTEGLLIITNDGLLVHNLTNPKKECPKKYYLRVEGTFVNKDIEECKEGFVIEDGKGEKYKTKKANLEIISSDEAYLTITEGKFHQVKRMMEYLDKKVVYLKRVSIGGLLLDSKLNVGSYRLLTSDEIEILKLK